MNPQEEPAYDQRKEEEDFLLTVLDGISDDIKFVEHGGRRPNQRGRSKIEILAGLRRHERNVTRAITHVRAGGPLTDIVPIVWGTK